MSKMNIPDEAAKIFKDLKINSSEATWDCHGTPVVLHKYIEIIGAKLNVSIDSLDVIEANAKDGIVSMKCVASIKDRQVISYGECSPKNNKNAYPYAMAEKRAVDRCILKLANLHGFVYSENEIDDKAPSNKPKTAEKKIISAEPTIQMFITEMNHTQSYTEFNSIVKKYAGAMIIAKKENPELYQEAKTKYELIKSNYTRSI
tara:strand:- start:941 stop:1549 length:609 start_codon:yes stop_codon:yes gene_type:complete